MKRGDSDGADERKLVDAYKTACLKPAEEAEDAIRRLFKAFMSAPSLARECPVGFTRNFEAIAAVLVDLEVFASMCRLPDAPPPPAPSRSP